MMSSNFQNSLKDRDVHHCLSSAYNPHSNYNSTQHQAWRQSRHQQVHLSHYAVQEHPDARLHEVPCTDGVLDRHCKILYRQWSTSIHHLPPITTLYNLVQPCTTLFFLVQPFTTMYNSVQGCNSCVCKVVTTVYKVEQHIIPISNNHWENLNII